MRRFGGDADRFGDVRADGFGDCGEFGVRRKTPFRAFGGSRRAKPSAKPVARQGERLTAADAVVDQPERGFDFGFDGVIVAGRPNGQFDFEIDAKVARRISPRFKLSIKPNRRESP